MVKPVLKRLNFIDDAEMQVTAPGYIEHVTPYYLICQPEYPSEFNIKDNLIQFIFDITEILGYTPKFTFGATIVVIGFENKKDAMQIKLTFS